jgi:hypothetical protein
MDVFFSDDEMDSLMSVGNARNEYQAVARPGKTAETNLALGDTITVHLKDRKIDRAVVRGKASGEYHMEAAIKDTSAARLEVVKYQAPRIEFIVPKDRIVLDEGAHLEYREVSLSSRRVEFDSQEQVLVASGNPQLVDRGDKVQGHLMTYDLESREGTIYQAETTYERGLYHGERIRKVDENELDVKSGSYSTCSLDQPHYHFQARWMKIYLKDKMVAKPVVFYVRNVPLLALPFWIFPIKPGRHSGSSSRSSRSASVPPRASSSAMRATTTRQRLRGLHGRGRLLPGRALMGDPQRSQLQAALCLRWASHLLVRAQRSRQRATTTTSTAITSRSSPPHPSAGAWVLGVEPRLQQERRVRAAAFQPAQSVPHLEPGALAQCRLGQLLHGVRPP